MGSNTHGFEFCDIPKKYAQFRAWLDARILDIKVVVLPRFFKVLPIFESSNEVPNHLENRDREQHALILDGLLE